MINNLKFLFGYLTLLCICNESLHAQIISNKSVAVSITSGTVISVDSLNNDISSTLSNDGTLNLYTLNNSGSIQGNGTLNISKSFSSTGTFFSGVSTVNYTGSIDQTVIPVNYYNLTVSENGTRTITLDSSAAIGIANIFSVAGGNTTYILKGTTLDFNGTTPQNVPPFLYNNLTVDNSAGASLDGISTVEGILKAANGDFNTNNYLTLLSTASCTALIDVSGNGEVLNNVTMQRYIASAHGYKYLSSPFQSATVNELSDDIDLSASFPTFYRYDEDLSSSGWMNYTNTSGILNPMEGYAANFGTAATPATIDMTGVVTNHDVSLSSLYNHDQPYTKGFHLAGNPYPSPIDWNADDGWTKSNIDDAIYYFNAGNVDQYTGTYSSYINGISSDGFATDIIPAMQGFFIHVSDGSYPVTGTLAANNAVRVTNSISNFHKPARLPGLIRLQVSFVDEATADPLVVYFDESATPNMDRNLDALKLINTNSSVPSIYALCSDREKLSISAVPTPQSSTVIPLGIETKKAGVLSITVPLLQAMPAGMHVYLQDASSGITQELTRTSVYNFSLDEGIFENRFSLVFSPNGDYSGDMNNEYFHAYASGNHLIINTNVVAGDESRIILADMFGRETWSQQFTGNGNYLVNEDLGAGIYVVSLYSNKEVYSEKLLMGVK